MLEPGDAPGSLRLSGELDISNVAEVGRQLSEALRRHNGLRLDLQGLTFMDSQGLQMLIALGKQAVEQSTTVSLLNSPAHVRQLLDLAVPDGIPGVNVFDVGKK